MPDSRTATKVMMKVDARDMVYAAVNRHMTKEEIDMLEFNKEGGGWVGQVSKHASSGTSQFKRLSDKKSQQVKSQLKTQSNLTAQQHKKTRGPHNPIERQSTRNSLAISHDKSGAGNSHIEYSSDDGSSEHSAPSIDMDELFKSQLPIENPFGEKTSDPSSSLALWVAPEHAQPRSAGAQPFERPVHDKRSSFTSPTALVQRLQSIIAEKDKQIELLQCQLLKIHKETAVLAEHVAKRRGPDADELQRRNLMMKDQLERCLKENAILRGQQMASKNSTLKKLRHRDELDETYSCLSRPSSVSFSRATTATVRADKLSEGRFPAHARRAVSFSPRHYSTSR